MNRISKPIWLALGVVMIALAAVATTAIQQKSNTAAPLAAAHDHAAAPAAAPAHQDAAEPAHAADTHQHAAAHSGEPADAHAGEPATAAAHAHGEGEAEGEGHLDEVTLAPEALKQNGIKTEAVSKMEMNEVFTAPARVSYNTEAMAHVGTPVQGRVAEIKIKLGDAVKKGDLLLAIDSPALGEAQSEYLQKRTQADVARSGLEVVQTAAERARRLYNGKGISLSELQKREGEYKAAQGTLRAAEAAVTAAENSLHLWGMGQADVSRLVKTGEIQPRFLVHAPIDGTVVQREATLGEVVGPDREALLVLADLKTLWVLADIPEDRLHKIAPGAPATITVDAIPGQQFSGKVGWIAPELSKETRTAQVRVEIANGHLPLKPGMFAQVGLNLGGGAKVTALAVPEAAVQDFEGGPTVFIEADANPCKFAACPVKVGPSVGGLVPILSGLKEGSRVATAGAFVIKAELAKGIMEGKTCSGH